MLSFTDLVLRKPFILSFVRCCLKNHIATSGAALCMMVVMLPAFLLGMYEKNGQPLEKIIRNIVQVAFLRPKQRPYQTNNFYAVLERQDSLDKEVGRIVKKSDR